MTDAPDTPSKPEEADGSSQPVHPALQDDSTADARKTDRWLVKATDRQGQEVEREYEASERDEAIMAARAEGLRPLGAMNRSRSRRRMLLGLGVCGLLVLAMIFVTQEGFRRQAFIADELARQDAAAQENMLPTATVENGADTPLPDEQVAGTGWTLTTLEAQLPQDKGWQWERTFNAQGNVVHLIRHPDLPHITIRSRIDGEVVEEFWVAAEMPEDAGRSHKALLDEVKMRISDGMSLAAMVAGADRSAAFDWAGQVLARYAAGQTSTESDSRRVNRHVMQIALTEGDQGVLFIAGVVSDETPDEAAPTP